MRLPPGLYIVGVALCFFLWQPSHTYAEKISTFLWVECEGSNRTLNSTSCMDALLRDAQDWGIDTLFVQVYRGDRAWFDSRICDPAPFQAFRKREKKDLLAYLLEQAHGRGLKVHAWFNVFRIGKDPNARVLKRLGRSAVTCDNKGRSMLDYPGLQLPGADNNYYEADGTGYWLEPGDERVQKYLLSVLKELVGKYPALDGVQLDFVRLPFVVPFSPGARFGKGITYGYGPQSVKRFRKATGWDPMRWDRATASALAWDDWRRNQVTEFVRKAKGVVREKLPSAKFSTAVICWGDRAYLTAFQDWRGWLWEGDVDFVGLMNYSMESRLFSQVLRSALAFNHRASVWVGLGPYLLGQRENVFRAQWQDARDQLGGQKAGGIGFFSYDSLKQMPNLVRMIKEEARRGASAGTS